MTDPITDMLNRIRNAQAVVQETVSFPFSNLKYEVSRILEKQGFIGKIDKKGRSSKRIIEIILKYNGKEGAILGLRRISKPGQRIYSSSKDLGKYGKGRGILIISTPKGLMVDKEARKQKLGGEVMCEVW